MSDLDGFDASLYDYPDVDRPWIRTNFVATVDGSSQDGDGVSGALGGEVDRAAFSAMRDAADVVLVGAGTARAEGYGPIEDGGLVLVTGSLDVPGRLREPGVFVVTTTAADPEKVMALTRAGVEVLQHGDDAVDWTAVLADFDARGWRNILCEGGPGLHGTLLEEDLVDELCVTVAPVAAAGQGSRIATSSNGVSRALTLGHAVVVDGVLLTRWVRERS